MKHLFRCMNIITNVTGIAIICLLILDIMLLMGMVKFVGAVLLFLVGYGMTTFKIKYKGD